MEIANDPRIAEELAKDPKFANELELFDGPTFFRSPEAVERLIYHYELRKEAVTRSNIDTWKSLDGEPYASEDELSAGVYKEVLEPQVREAVFTLRNKGYETFESGFRDLAAGGQYIGFRKEPDRPIYIDAGALNEKLKRRGVVAKFDEDDDRYTLSLASDVRLSLDEWGQIWNEVADTVPAEGKSKEATVSGADLFREQQKKLRTGEDVYLGGNYFFKGGKIIREG